MHDSVTVVLVHWNQSSALARTVRAFRESTLCRRIVVVDNGSNSEHANVLAGLDVEVIRCGSNTGFGPAANRGMETWLTSDDHSWCVVAPHDAVPADGTVETLVETLQARPDVGLICADVGDDRTPLVDHAFGPISVAPTVESGFEDCDYPHGTLFVARRSCIDEIGLFDERYFAYCEEADLGLRARSAGWSVGLVRGARVTNTSVGTPAPFIDYLMERNTLLLLAEHFGRRKAVLRALIGLGQIAVGVVKPSSRGDFWSLRARLRALFDAARGRWGAPPPSLQADRTSPQLLLGVDA